MGTDSAGSPAAQTARSRPEQAISSADRSTIPRMEGSQYTVLCFMEFPAFSILKNGAPPFRERAVSVCGMWSFRDRRNCRKLPDVFVNIIRLFSGKSRFRQTFPWKTG